MEQQAFQSLRRHYLPCTDIYFPCTTISSVPSTLPYRSSVSKVTVAWKVSLSPESFRSCGTRHEYPQVPPQPKGILPPATFLPVESVMLTVGSRFLN
jgi:hypothetical protein